MIPKRAGRVVVGAAILYLASIVSAQSIPELKEQALGGNAKAQLSLGMIYAAGYAVQKDEAEALHWYRRAAEQGDAEAQYDVARAYAKGEGVPQDSKEAFRWAQPSAQQGYPQAEYSLGFSYDVGEGVPRDPAQAAYWYRKAAEQSLADAQYCLGLLYYVGRGVPQSYVEAYFYLDLASSKEVNGVKPEAVARLRDLTATYLTKSVLLQAQDRANKWFVDHPRKANPQRTLWRIVGPQLTRP
jgi:TPR repeat protein